MKTSLSFIIFLFLTISVFSQNILFEIYKTNVYTRNGITDPTNYRNNSDLVEKDKNIKEIFNFDLDCRTLKISSYPNLESEIRTYTIDSVENVNNNIKISSKISLNENGELYNFIAYINVIDDDSYIYFCLYDESTNESIFFDPTHFYYEK